jgi:hypothetical protein
LGGRAVLSEALVELGARLGDDGGAGVHGRVVAELLRRIREDDGAETPTALGRSLAASGASEEERSALADVAGTIARRMALEDEAPREPGAAFAWLVLLAAVDRLYGSALASLGRLPFISDRLLEFMADEARAALGDCSGAEARVTASGGRALAALAVSRKLQGAISNGLETPVAPGYRALYAYDPPGSHVRTHVDSSEYELIFHMILEHQLPGDGASGSALVAHLPDRGAPTHVWLGPGEGVALSGRGTLHSWQRLGPGERRTMVEIAWVRA